MILHRAVAYQFQSGATPIWQQQPLTNYFHTIMKKQTTPKRRGPKPRPGPDQAALDRVRAEFCESGITLASWAKANGFARMTVVDVLLGRRAGHHGEAHRVCVALGLKKGRVANVASFKSAQVAA